MYALNQTNLLYFFPHKLSFAPPHLGERSVITGCCGIRIGRAAMGSSHERLPSTGAWNHPARASRIGPPSKGVRSYGR